MGQFDDRATQPQRGPADIFRWKVLGQLSGEGRRGENGFRTPLRDNDGALVRALPRSITWVGHATFVLRLGGMLVATDPIWSERIAGAVPRLAPPGVALGSLDPIDVVTVSHNHYDHLD